MRLNEEEAECDQCGKPEDVNDLIPCEDCVSDFCIDCIKDHDCGDEK